MSTLQRYLKEFDARWHPGALPLSAFFVFVIGLLLAAQFSFTAPGDFVLLTAEIPEHRKIAIQLIVSRSEVMATWALAIVASLAFILNYFGQKPEAIGGTALLASFVTFLFAIASIFFSHVTYDVMVRMLLQRFDPFSNDGLFLAARLQYFCLICCVIVFVTFVFVLAASRVRSDGQNSL